MDINTTAERLFEYATEDVSGLLWAIEAWQKNEEEYSGSYIFAHAVGSMARSKRALERLLPLESNEEYAPYADKLIKKFKEGTKALSSLADQEKEEITGLFKEGGEFLSRLASLKNLLSDIKDMAEDGMLLRNDDWANEELRDAERDFILIFTEFYAISQDCPENIAAGKEFKEWKQGVSDLEQEFKKIFGLFIPVAGFIKTLSVREYHPDFWWFTRAPEAFPAAEQELTEQDIAKLGTFLTTTLPENCSDDLLVIAYANGELSGNVRKEIEPHITRCAECADLVLAVRRAGEVADADEKAEKDHVTHAEPAVFSDIIEQLSRYPLQLPSDSQLNYIDTDLADLGDLLLLCAPEPEMLPMAARELEERGEKTIFAFLATIDRGKLLNLEVVPVTILDEDFDKDQSRLTCMVKLPDEISEHPSRYALKGMFMRHDGKISWPYERLKRGKDNPEYVTANFWLPRTEVKDGQLKLVIFDNQSEG